MDSAKDAKPYSPLPWKQLAVLIPLRLFHDIDMTMIFSYAPKMIKSFGTPEVDVGYDSGLLNASMYFGVLCCNLVWSYLADLKGKKFSVVSTCLLAVGVFMFGLSRSFTWALVTRLMQVSTLPCLNILGFSFGLLRLNKGRNKCFTQFLVVSSWWAVLHPLFILPMLAFKIFHFLASPIIGSRRVEFETFVRLNYIHNVNIL